MPNKQFPLKKFKGTDTQYSTLHHWVTRQLGSPSVCWNCGSTDRKHYSWANESGEYKKELNDWIRLCYPCHVRKDGSKLSELYGTKARTAKLTEEQVREIYLSPKDGAAVARDYGISQPNAWAIRAGRTWRHVTRDLPSRDRLADTESNKEGVKVNE